MEINITEIRQEKKQHLDDAEILLKKADAAKRDFTRNEERQWDNHIAEAKRLSEVILREPTSIAEKHYPMGTAAYRRDSRRLVRWRRHPRSATQRKPVRVSQSKWRLRLA